MKKEELIVLGLAGVAVYMIMKAGGFKMPIFKIKMENESDDFVNEILDTSGKAWENGWRYFDNGTSIDPEGNYYYQGQMVYRQS